MGMISIRRTAQKLLAPVVIVLVVALTVGMFYIGIPRSQQTSGIYKGPSVKFDGKKVSDAKFNEYIGRATQQAGQFAQFGLQYSAAQIRDSALQFAIRDFVIQQEVKKAKIKVDKAEAEKMIKKYLPTEEELQSYLSRVGLPNKNALIKDLMNGISEQKLYVKNAKNAKMKVAKDEVHGYMEDITVSHILVGLKDQDGKAIRTEAEALKRAEEVYQKVTGKSDFAKLAKEYSDAPGSKDKGGVIGPMKLQQFKSSMVPEFVDSALALKEGEISKPVKTEYGYHIIKLDKRALPKGKEYKEEYAEIEESLLVQKYVQSDKYNNWMKKLTEAAEAKMEILDPAIRGYRLAQKEKWAEAAQAYEKALKRKYYKNQQEIYLEAAKAYTKAKNFSSALKVLKKVPAEYKETVDYQITLATVYKENKQPQKAANTLLEFGKRNAEELQIHQQLQQVFTEWKFTKSAKIEADIVAKLQAKEAAELEEAQKELEKKNKQAASTQNNDNTDSGTNSNNDTTTK